MSGLKVWPPPPRHNSITNRKRPAATVSIDNNDEDLYHSIHENGIDDRIADGRNYPEGHDRIPSNRTLPKQIHDLKRTKGKICKNGCGRWVYLQEDVNGKWRPHNQDNDEFHRCNNRPSKYKCYNCGINIVFDLDKVSKSGKPIPLNKSDLSPHQCPNNPLYTRR